MKVQLTTISMTINEEIKFLFLATNLSVKAVRELYDERMGIGNPVSLLNLILTGVGTAQKDVLLNGG